MNSPETIYHVTTLEALEIARGIGNYTCPSLQHEGFIHCCFETQISGVLQRYYKNVTGLLLLQIDPDKLESPLRKENTVGGTELFPHVYGVINLDAVTDVVEIEQSTYR